MVDVNKRKWIEEKVIQRYWVENCKKYARKDGRKIITGRYNRTFDRYPDTYCTLSDGKEVPVEVEWRTTDFDHPIEELRNNDGFIVVLEENDNFELEQITIKRNDFTKWFENNSRLIAENTIDSVIKTRTSRAYPKLWFIYVAKSAVKNYEEISRKKGVWGVPGSKKFMRIRKYETIQKNDLITFITSYNAPKGAFGGRMKFEQFQKGGFFTEVNIFRVSKGYYYDETKIWPEVVGEVYPHRFDFDKKPILTLHTVNIKKLADSTKRKLHSIVSVPFTEGEPFELVDMMSYSK